MCRALQFAFVRNWVVRNFYPVHSFLKPAAFDCGTLEAKHDASAAIDAAATDAITEQPGSAEAEAGSRLDILEQASCNDGQSLSSELLKGITQRGQNWPREVTVGDW